MKHILILGLAVTLLASSCQKNSLSSDKRGKSNPVAKLSRDGLNSEGLRIADAIDKYDYEVAIVDNPNYGLFSQNAESDIYIAGRSDVSLTVTINGAQFQPVDADGHWWKQDIALKNFFGQTVTVHLEDNADGSSHDATLYIPTQLQASKLSIGDGVEINRTGNTLNWNPDPDNPTGKAVIYYTLYDNDDYAGNSGFISSDADIVDDNGSLNIDYLISDPQVKRINFIIGRGNATSFVANGHKVLFDIRSCDSHEYIIQ